MPFALEHFRPTLPPTVRTRTRQDGTAGLHDPATGRSAEIGADQVSLLSFINSERTLGEIAEAHYAIHRFVPFTALRDLLRTLALRGLLTNSPEELRQVGLTEKPSWTQRDARVLLSVRIPGAGALSVLVTAAWLAASAWLLLFGRPAPLTAWDVLWALFGVALALTGRELFRAAAATFDGAGPTHWTLRLRFFMPFVSPDGAGIVLLDKKRRAGAHLFALLGTTSLLPAVALSKGVAFGALVVFAADLCPFAPTSAGKLLATLAGRVDLREHARAYLSRRFLRRVTSSGTFEGEGSLILSALFSLAWLGLTARVLLTYGAVWVLQLLAVAVDTKGALGALAYAGAVVLGLLIPVSLVGLAAALWKAIRALLPQKASTQADETRAADAVELAAIPLFSRLDPKDMEALGAASELRTYPPGRAIVTQGTPGDCFFALREGEVTVEMEEPSGLQREVARLGPGDCFGETALLEQELRTATVRARTQVSVVALARDAFQRARQGLQAEQVTSILRATAALRRNPLFHRMSSDRLSALALRLRPHHVKTGQVIIREGEAGTDFFLVNEGAVEVMDAEGAVLATLGPGDYFGEVALLRDVPRTATVRAKSDAFILSLDKDTFLKAMAADLALSAQVETLAAERTGRAA